MKIKRAYEFLVRALIALPYKPFVLQRDVANNRVATKHLINLLNQLGFKPRHLVDVGANYSQWAYWIKKEWPGIRVTSFEPHPIPTPIGEVMRIALSDESKSAFMTTEGWKGQSSGVTDKNTGVHVQVARFDSLPVVVERPALLKIDTDCTAKTLDGFGDRLKEFSVIVVEMDNEIVRDSKQQSEVWSIAVGHGFINAQVIDMLYTIGGSPSYDIVFWKL